jgi:hypothetical protein
MAMTSEAKRALSQTIRKVRARLIEDLAEATEGAYRLPIDASKAVLSESARIRRMRLESWIAEQVRPLPEKARAAAAARAQAEVIRNDPEREALDVKLAASKKLENHEIASKTQMFTELAAPFRLLGILPRARAASAPS